MDEHSIFNFEKYCKTLSNDQIFHIKVALDTLTNDSWFSEYYTDLDKLREALEFSIRRVE